MKRKIFSVSIFMFILLFAFTGCATSKEVTKDFTNELIKSVQENHTSKVEQLLKDNPNEINVDILDENGKSILMNAIIDKKNDAILYSLIDSSKNLNIQDKDGNTALMYAIQSNTNPYIIEYMVKKGVNVNLKNKENNTALLLLCTSKYDSNIDNITKIMEYLITGSADLNAKDKDGRTPLINAAATIYNDWTREEVLQYLIKSGADEKIKDNYGFDYKYHLNNTVRYETKKEKELNKTPIFSSPVSPKIGMTAGEVLTSTWGQPEDIKKTTTKYGTSEQWVYDLGKYIYLDNGIVTAIQQ
ncbi:ankyrin repeat domain-containing protein [Clostridium sp. BSD9I1]|uniref:ankyrin repeat domain-containing protein n=1 Tax=Clostridium sp. BSD9I1 TaxID=2003589 RepID=UPI001644DDBF|nr:ankyrin repeat domain-containing protein [Clostridium sp. BSD9I1]